MLIQMQHFQNLSEKIDNIVTMTGVDYIDAILSYCQDHNLEIETIGQIISKNPTLKEKVEIEAGDLHFLKA
jgi:hypothetical protein